MGTFDSPREAAIAYDRAVIKYGLPKLYLTKTYERLYLYVHRILFGANVVDLVDRGVVLYLLSYLPSAKETVYHQMIKKAVYESPLFCQQSGA